MARVSPSNLVDREQESLLFASLLRCEDDRRIILVSDEHGTGKTDVLRKFEFLCKTDHQVPVAMLRFDDFESVPSMLRIVEHAYTLLSGWGLSFPEYQRLSDARAMRMLSAFVPHAAGLVGTVDAREAEISGNAMVGGIVAEHIGSITLHQEWNDAVERKAVEMCVTAFLDDLLTRAQQRPVVLLFDTVEKIVETDIQRWLLQDLIRKRMPQGAAGHNLVIVLAGVGLNDLLASELPPAVLDRVVKVQPSTSLRSWPLDCVRRMLEENGYRNLDDDKVAVVQRYLATGGNLPFALVIAENMSRSGS